jgi:hypothetical protein
MLLGPALGGLLLGPPVSSWSSQPEAAQDVARSDGSTSSGATDLGQEATAEASNSHLANVWLLSKVNVQISNHQTAQPSNGAWRQYGDMHENVTSAWFGIDDLFASPFGDSFTGLDSTHNPAFQPATPPTGPGSAAGTTGGAIGGGSSAANFLPADGLGPAQPANLAGPSGIGGNLAPSAFGGGLLAPTALRPTNAPGIGPTAGTPITAGLDSGPGGDVGTQDWPPWGGYHQVFRPDDQTPVPPAAGSWVHVKDNPGSGNGFLSTGWSQGLNSQASPLATGPFQSQVARGDYVLVFVSVFNQSDNFISGFSCTDNAQTPNTYATVLDYQQGQQTSGVLIFGARINSLPASGNLNCTVSWTNVPGDMGALVCASEFSGGSLNTDGSNGTSQGDYTMPAQTGPITTTVPNDLILTIEENDNTGAGSTMSTPPGFTTIAFCTNGEAGIVSGAAWEVANGIYSGNLTWDTVPNDTWSTGQVAVRPGGVAGLP